MKFLNKLLFAGVLLLSSFASQSAVLFPEWNVDDGSTLAQKFTLDPGAGRNSISQEQAHSAPNSIKFINASGDSLVADLGSPHARVYARWWWWFSSTTSVSVQAGNHGFRFGQKLADQFISKGQFDTLPIKVGSSNFGWDIFDGNAAQFYDSGSTYEGLIPFPRNQWFKFEVYVDVGSAGVANGTVKIAIDDVIKFNSTAVQFRGAGGTLTGFDTFLLNSNWDNGTALWYQDDVYVSDTDEIGGGGGLPTIKLPITIH